MSKGRYKQIMKTFGARLKQARELAGYKSAQQFAGVLGIEPHTYRKYERGASEPNYDTLTRICELLEVTPNHLLPLAASMRRREPGEGGPSHQSAA
jgi:transcriptional regulator with XRE-family HTH domain